MLRLILEWAREQAPEGHPLHFTQGARSFAEVLLPIHFRPLR